VDTAAKAAEAEAKVQEEKKDKEKQKASAKAAAAAPANKTGDVPMPLPKPLSKAATQPPVHKAKGPLVTAPKEESPVVSKAKNAFEALSMEDGAE